MEEKEGISAYCPGFPHKDGIEVTDCVQQKHDCNEMNDLKYKSLMTNPSNRNMNLNIFKYGDDDPNQEYKLVSKMNTMRMNKQLCDLRIKVDDHEYWVHKLILCSHSTYFHTMLNSEFTEATQDSIELKEMDGRIFGLLLNTMYGESISVSHDELLLLIKSADMLCFDCFLTYLKSFLTKNWSKGVVDLSNLFQYIEQLNLNIPLLPIVDYFLGLNKSAPDGAMDMSVDFIRLIAERYFHSYLYFDKTKQTLATLISAIEAFVCWTCEDLGGRMPHFLTLITLYRITAVTKRTLGNVLTNLLDSRHVSSFSCSRISINLIFQNYLQRVEIQKEVSDLWYVRSDPFIVKLGLDSIREHLTMLDNEELIDSITISPFTYVLSESCFHIIDTRSIFSATHYKAVVLPSQAEGKRFCLVGNVVVLLAVQSNSNEPSEDGMWLYHLNLEESNLTWARTVSLSFCYVDVSLIAKDDFVYIVGGSKTYNANQNGSQNPDDSLWEYLDTLETPKFGDVYLYNVSKGSLKFLKCLNFPSSSTKLCFRGNNLHVFPEKVSGPIFTQIVLDIDSLQIVCYECNTFMPRVEQLLCVKADKNELVAAWFVDRNFEKHLFISRFVYTTQSFWVNLPISSWIRSNYPHHTKIIYGFL